MKIIPWSRIPPESLISSTVSDAVAAWDAGVTYFAGNMVYGADGVTVYEAAVGPATFLAGQYCGQAHGENLHNKGFNPDEYPTVPAMDRTAYPDYIDMDDCYVESGKLWWIKRGPYYENKYRVFDESPDLLTVSDTRIAEAVEIVMTIESPRDWAALAFVRLNATSVRISYSHIQQYSPWMEDKLYATGDIVNHREGYYSARHGQVNPVDAECPVIYNSGIMPDSGYLIPLDTCGYAHAGEPLWDPYDPPMIVVDEVIDLRIPFEQAMPGGDIRRSAIYQAAYQVPEFTPVTITITHNIFLRNYYRLDGPSRAEVGLILMGFLIGVGATLYGTSTGITDYSKKERDAFGRAKITQRGYTNKVTYKVSIDTDKIYPVKEFLSILRALVSVYIGDENMPETIVAGYFKDFSIPIESFSDSVFTLEVEGL